MPEAELPDPKRPRFQFGLGTLFLLTALCSVLAAALAGMLRSRAGISPMPPGFFELMAAAAPVAVLILLSLLRAGVLWLKRRRR
jgi:hypothetical protein